MAHHPEHSIPFTGLKDGTHAYRFEIGREFLMSVGEDEITDGQVTVDVTLDKSTTMIVAEIHVEGPVTVHCDRCDGAMECRLSGNQRQIFQLNATEDLDDDELVALPPQAHTIDLGHYIYECVRLALPARHVHAPGQCDPEAEAALNRLAVEKEPVPDPRWAALQELKNQRP
ncbi:MAG: DUF177 domain-containing protein [Flavobacteriales bacterium]|nr:DUF177 domain-containing protein [Flavobacteriales bacterium]